MSPEPSDLHSFACTNPKFMKGWCGTHATTRVLRCRHCEGCIAFKNWKVRKDIKTRVEEANITKPVLLWTLGTNWKYTPENLDKLRVAWNTFNIYMHKTYGYNMLMRVYEAGSKGGRLHIHFVTYEFQIKHTDARAQWARITGIENPNVRFDHAPIAKRTVPKKGIIAGRPLPAKYAFLYLAKYLTKDSKLGSVKIFRNGEEVNYTPPSLYWGNDLKYKYKLVSEDIQQTVDDSWTGEKIYSNGHGSFKRVSQYWFPTRNQLLQFTDRFRDVPVRCPEKNCENHLLIKAGNFLRYGELHKQCNRHDALPYLDWFSDPGADLPELIRTDEAIQSYAENKSLQINAFM
jgi:hypothetical protein